MKFTGVYASYYQDICKQWDKVIAKCKNLEKSNPGSYTRLSIQIKSFNKTVDDFKRTSFVDNRTVLVNGIKKNYYRTSATLLQIQCISTLKSICYRATIDTDYSVIKSWEDCDALYKEVEKVYVFLLEILKLYNDEYKNVYDGKNDLGALRIRGEISEQFDQIKKKYLSMAPMIRANPSLHAKSFSQYVLSRCNRCIDESRSIIFYKPYFL